MKVAKEQVPTPCASQVSRGAPTQQSLPTGSAAAEARSAAKTVSGTAPKAAQSSGPPAAVGILEPLIGAAVHTPLGTLC